MKKLVLIIVVPLLLVSISSSVSAQGIQQQNRAQDPTSQGNQVQNQNQIQIQNQGEGTQLRVATQHMEQLMDMEGLEERVRNQARTIAQEQVQAQSQIQTQLGKLESRPNLVKKLLGPDYGAIKNLKQQMEHNRLRIQQLQELQNQLANQADETQLQAAIQALVEQNTSLQDQVQAEEQVGSIFGWLIRLFYR